MNNGNMKKTTKVLLLATFSIGIYPVMAAPLTLVKDGQPNATIVLRSSAQPPAKAAAEDLQLYIRKMTGVALPLNTDGKDVPGITLNVGKTVTSIDSDFPDKSLNPETYKITQRNDDVYFEGNYPSPTAFAVYSFLEDQLGIRWFAPGEDWEYIPQLKDKSTFTVDVKDVTSEPGTSPRVWSTPQQPQDWREWQLRNKAVQSERVPKRNFQNFMYRIFPPSKYAKTHPEYYPLVSGKRWIPSSDSNRIWWPCIGNKDVQRITVEYIRDYFKSYPELDSFSLGMDDIYVMCGDPLCRAMDHGSDDIKHRNYSSRYYKFINIIAKEIKKSNPDKYIGVLIYSSIIDPPVDVLKLEDNVFGYIASGSSGQWFIAKNEKNWKNLARAWHRRIRHLSRYDYLEYGSLVPAYFPHSLAESIKFDKSLGFEGMYTEVKAFRANVAPMLWMMAQLQWSPQKNTDVLLHDFYTKMFPSTKITMAEYYALLERSWNTPRPGHPGPMYQNIVHQAVAISPEAVEKGLELLDEAYNHAKTLVEKRRIDVVRGGLTFASFAVLEYNLAQQLSSVTITNEQQADASLKIAQQFVDLVKRRPTYWAAAERRQDLLGESIRALQVRAYPTAKILLQSDFAPIEGPAIPGILHIINWYQKNQPGKVKGVLNDLMTGLPQGAVKDSLEASQWLDENAENSQRSLLTNGDLEEDVIASTGTSAEQSDWQTKGAPPGWKTWMRYNTGSFMKAPGKAPGSAGIRVEARQSNDLSALLQVVSVQPGKKYLAVVWVKLDDINRASNIMLYLKYRAHGWYTGDGAIKQVTAGKTKGWQRILLVDTVPPGATAVSVELRVAGTSATFSDAAFYQIGE